MDNWLITENTFYPQALHYKETVFTIGNGYLGTRGAFEEGYPGDIATTMVHGVFDDVPIVYTELANAPNWLIFDLYVNGVHFQMDQGEVLAYERKLDLHAAVLARRVRWRSPAGETVDLEIERFASLANEHLLAIRYRATAVDFEGQLEFRVSTAGHVDNAGFMHWERLEQGRTGQQGAYLKVRTRYTHVELCEAFHLKVSGELTGGYEYWDSAWSPTVIARTRVQPGQTVTAEKLVALFTSRDTPDPKPAALEALAEAVETGYAALKADNEAAWSGEWERCNITIEGDDEADQAMRYSLFQLLIAAPHQDDRVSIAAKSLSGFGYRGHVFWDTEIFILPFFTFTSPHIARNLLLYRYHTLPGARRKALSNGYEGAMFAWESAASGDETTPRWVPNPVGPDLIRIWCGDIEHHITADVTYAVVQYWGVTGDDAFMQDYGAEIVLDTARFWGSRAEWNPAQDRFEIKNVIGPDEYHDRIDNNVYTNVMARWNLRIALEVLAWLEKTAPGKAGELITGLDLTPERLNHWQAVIAKMYLGVDPKTGLFEQFEGFFERKGVDLNEYEPRTQSMQALLGIEEIQNYQIIKQPDVLMLLYLLHDEYSLQTLRTNWDYYTPRTDLTYGSSLGPAIHSILAARLGEVDNAYRHFIHAARTDLQDARGNTKDGIHAATSGGLWQAAVFGFGGLELTAGGPQATPRLPAGWTRLAFRIQFHGRPYDFDLHTKAPAAALAGPPAAGRLHEKSEAPTPKLPILGAIFDLDGVLTDTSELHYQGWKRLADEEGLPFSREDNEALRGVSRRESLLRLLKGRSFPEARLQEMMERKNRYYQEAIANLSTENLLPGVRRLLEEIRAAGVKIAIGSASKNASPVVERLGLAPLVDAISDGYSVERQKPAPDLFLHASAQLGLPHEQCVVFEDAQAGVEAALAGGMWAVGLGPMERVGAAHLVLPDLKNIHWAEIADRLAQAEPTR